MHFAAAGPRMTEDGLWIAAETAVYGNPYEGEARREIERVVRELRAYCVARAEAKYAGGEGAVNQVEFVTLTPEGGHALAKAEAGRLEGLVADLVTDHMLPDGWNEETGSNGTVTFDLAEGRVEHVHDARVLVAYRREDRFAV